MRRRDLLAIVGGVAAIALVLWLFGSRNSAETTSEPLVSGSATSAPVTDGGGASDGGVSAAETAGTDEGAGVATDEDKEAASARVDAAARVWVDHSLSVTDWQDRLRPQVAPSAWPSLALPDPQRVGATEVTGEPKLVNLDAGSGEYDVPTDAGALRVVVVNGGDGTWLVSDFAKDV